MRKPLASVIAVGLLLAIVVARSGESTAVKDGGTFRVAMPGSSFDSIDPALATVPPPGFLFRATCAYLLNFPDKPPPAGLRLVPEVAADHPRVSRDGRSYTVKIRKGFRYSTGAPVTAKDFAHEINRELNPALDAVAASSWQDVVGAQDVLARKTATARGVVAHGSTLSVHLMKPAADFPARLASLCALPASLPFNAEGVQAPVPSAGPYRVSEYVPGQRVVLVRNRFYRGNRPHHVDRFVVSLDNDPGGVIDEVEKGKADWGWTANSFFAQRGTELAARYGINRSQFFVKPGAGLGTFLRVLVLNTAGPLFKNNVKLRRAVNFAVDRKALLAARGTFAGYNTDQFLPPLVPGFRNARIYPLRRPDVARARTLARGHTRGGKAVFYGPSIPLGLASGAIVRDSLKKIGLDVEVKVFPFPVLMNKLSTPGEPFDIGWIGWGGFFDPSLLSFLFDGRTIGKPGFGNWSYFNSPKYNRLLDRAARLTGRARYRAYGKLDVELARDAAPAVAYAYDNAITFVSRRTGCIVLNPSLDLAAVCLR